MPGHVSGIYCTCARIKTYPTIVVLVQKADKLAGSQLQLILKSGLEVELDAVNSRLSGTSSSGNGGSTGRWAGALTRGNRVHTELCAGGARRYSREIHHGPCEIQRLRGVILPHGRFPYKADCSTRNHGSLAGCRSWRDPRGRVGGDSCADAVLDRAHGSGVLFNNGRVHALGVVSKGVGGWGTRARRRTVHAIACESPVLVLSWARGHCDSCAAAGTSVRMHLGAQIGMKNRSQAQPWSLARGQRCAGDRMSIGKRSAVLLIVGQPALLLDLLPASGEQEVDCQEDHE